MEPIHLFDLAAQQQRWLSASQSVISGNVANANTPDYKAKEVVPFADVLNKTQLQLVTTAPSHLDLSATGVPAVGVQDETTWETTDSGNSVSLEQEMISANDVNRNFSLNTNIVKAFHGMLMSCVKGS